VHNGLVGLDAEHGLAQLHRAGLATGHAVNINCRHLRLLLP
jgi:hypothetical protein